MTSNPPTQVQKEEILKLLKQGWSNVQIARKVGVSPGSVAAVKAHRTMGTYDSQERRGVSTTNQSSTLTDSPLDTGLKFGLERDLQLALRANLNQLENGLKAIDDGKEMQTEIGRIDITAEDRDGNIVVIELKSDIADEGIITQIQSYMGALRKVYKKTIRGIIVARTFPTKVELAAQYSNIKLVTYGYQFTFTTVDND